MTQDRLFMVYVGGMAPGCHVELHDVRFCCGSAIEDCYDDLRAQWWGTPESLHLDCWGSVEWADGHDVSLSDEPPEEGEPSLWFVNLGGYDPALFTELHENLLVVAADAREARRRALARIDGWTAPHKDNLCTVESIVDVAVALGAGRHVRLSPDPVPRPFGFEARYVPIGRPAS